jgi:beta-lactamase superfamily II metal-dependent hydrolase
MELNRYSNWKIYFLALVALFGFGCIGMFEEQQAPQFEPPQVEFENIEYPQDNMDEDNFVSNYRLEKPFEITFLDVGYGDSTLIRTENKTILFDTGPNTDASYIKNKLRENGIYSLDILILSSNDKKFISGTADILRSIPTKEVWVSRLDYESDPIWNEITTLLKQIKVKQVKYKDSFEDKDLKITVLNPFDDIKNSNSAMDSIALKAQYKDFCALLFSNSVASGASGSDAGTVFGGVDSRIISGSEPIKCEVLKVSAHGSGNSASFQLIDAMDLAEVAIISVGPNPPQNNYPEPTLIRRLLLRDLKIYITEKLGDIKISSNGNSYDIKSDRPYNTTYAKFINDVGYGGKLYTR